MNEPKKVCPECGIDMANVNPIAHALSHWNEYLDPARSGKEAIKRQKLCLAGGISEANYAKLHGEE